MKERVNITKELCEHVRILAAGGASNQKAAEITGASAATISRIKAAGFDLETFRKNTEKRVAEENEAARPAAAEEQVPGQIRMDLTPEEKPEMSEQVKMMRFQAHQADRIVKAIEENAVMLNTKLDRLNDTLCMILRAVRKE